MGNARSQHSRRVARWRDRPVVTLNERFGREKVCHGIVLGPPGMTYDDALQRIDKVFRESVEADSEQWTYDDVLESLVNDGFDDASRRVVGRSRGPV